MQRETSKRQKVIYNFFITISDNVFSCDDPDACSTKPVNQGFKGLGNQK